MTGEPWRDGIDVTRWPDVAARGLGGSVIAANDELFAAADNLVNDHAPVHDPALFASRGKAYDGWETRRRREDLDADDGDWAVVRLGVPAVVRGVVVDTAFFTGNFPPAAQVEGATLLGYPDVGEVLGATWYPLTGRASLLGDQQNPLAVRGPERLATHVRLRIWPDGGVARLRVHGEVVPDPRLLGSRLDLAATTNGGLITGCSNWFYSSPANVLAPGRASVMSDGWETSRRRGEGNDWVTVALAAPAVVHHVVIDTSRFVGNAPGQVRVSDVHTGAELLPRTRVQPDTEHRFRVRDVGSVAELRLDVYPDGGLSRLRVVGAVAEQARAAVAERWLGLLPAQAAADADPATFFD